MNYIIMNKYDVCTYILTVISFWSEFALSQIMVKLPVLMSFHKPLRMLESTAEKPLYLEKELRPLFSSSDV